MLHDFLLDLIRLKFANKISEIKYYQRFYLNTIQYSLKCDLSKFCNSVIKYKQNIGSIELNICIRQLAFLICHEFYAIAFDFFDKRFTDKKSRFNHHQITRNLFYVKQTEFRKLQKLFCYKVDSKFYVITDLNNEYLFT